MPSATGWTPPSEASVRPSSTEDSPHIQRVDMAQVQVTVNGRNYSIACDDGEEEHLAGLAEYVDGRVSELSSSLGQIGEGRLLLMASLLIADDLAETRDRLGDLESTSESARDAATNAIDSLSLSVTETMTAAAGRIEDIAARLENA